MREVGVRSQYLFYETEKPDSSYQVERPVDVVPGTFWMKLDFTTISYCPVESAIQTLGWKTGQVAPPMTLD